MLGVGLSLIRDRDNVPQIWILVFFLWQKTNWQCMLGVDLSLIRDHDNVPHACKAWILTLLIITCHDVEYVGYYHFHGERLTDNVC